METVREALLAVLTEAQVLLDEPLKEYTTFKIGGPADLFILPHTISELQFVMKTLRAEEIEPTILGGGSNVLVLDGGIRGVVVCLCEMKERMTVDGTILTATSGMMLKDLSEYAREHGLTGLEFAVGIPGTVGGGTFMNAGAYGGEMQQVIVKVRSVDMAGELHEYDKESCQFAYRHSLFQENHEIIVEVECALEKGQIPDITATMEDFTERRESKQPLEYASAGSTFKRPTGYFAGTLIDETGLKGTSVGDAQVSMKHAGFVINRGDASAEDVLALIHKVQDAIYEAHGVRLETEVRIMGEKK